jgi:fucose permease
MYWVFLTGIFIQSFGMKLLQTDTNPQQIKILKPLFFNSHNSSLVFWHYLYVGAEVITGYDIIKVLYLSLVRPMQFQSLPQ